MIINSTCNYRRQKKCNKFRVEIYYKYKSINLINIKVIRHI